MITSFILLKSEKNKAKWQEHEHKLNPEFFESDTDYISFIKSSLNDCNTDYALFLAEDILVSPLIHEHINSLIQELDSLYPNWGIASNSGVCANLEIIKYSINHLEFTNISAYPKPALSIGDDIILINLKNFKQEFISHISVNTDFSGSGLVLSQICLKNNLLPVIDSRLICFSGPKNSKELYQNLKENQDFTKFITSNFINHFIYTIYGELNLKEQQNYSYLNPETIDPRDDIFECFDKALNIQGKTTLTICCRTIFKRPKLIERTILSLALASENENKNLEVKILIASDVDEESFTDSANKLRELYSGNKLEFKRFEQNKLRPSRTHLTIEAIKYSSTDYIWFIDDDDFIYPSVITDIARNLSITGRSFLIGDSVKISEQNEENLELFNSKMQVIHHYRSQNIFKSFTGNNMVAFCNCIFPVKTLTRQLQNIQAIGNFYEDYFFIMLTLTAPDIEIVTVNNIFAAISVRKGENTTVHANNEEWDVSRIAFISEIVNMDNARPIMWQIARQKPPAQNNLKDFTKVLRVFKLLIKAPTQIVTYYQKFCWYLRNYGFIKAINKVREFGHNL